MAGKTIGILALQGAFIEHQYIMEKLHCKTKLIRKKEQLRDIDGLIIPGGESTTIIKLMEEFNIIEMVKELGEKGLPIWGTCAGMIIMARKITNSKQTSINLIDITVKRNAFGRQINSFEKELYIKEIGNKPFPAVFIRAPLIMETGNNVKILAKHKDKAVIARQKNILVSSFHPELTDDLRLHKYFSDMIS